MRLLTALADSAVRTTAFAGVVALALAAWRVTRSRVRLYAWTIVLYASLALFMLGWAMPGLHVPLPAIPLSQNASPSPAPPPILRGVVALDRAEARASIARPAQATPLMPGSAAAGVAHTPRLSWSVVALAIYLAGVGILLLRAGVGWIVSRRLERSARPIDDEATLARAARHAAASGLQCAPRLAASDRLFVPVATSVLRPIIVLPGNWQEWGAGKLNAVLAHEIAHVARRDALTQRLSLVYRAVAWFNPLSWWLHHHLGDLAEQVSDEAVLGAGVEPTFYAETLLGFLADRMSCPLGRADWHVAMVHGASAAEQRVERILTWERGRSRRFSKALAVGILFTAAPAALLAAAVRPEVVNVQVVDLPVVEAPGLGPSATLKSIAMPAATFAPASDRVPITTLAPVSSSDAPEQISVNPASTAPIIDASQGRLANEAFAGHRVWVMMFDLNSMTPWEAHRALSGAGKWTDEDMSTADIVALLWVGSTINVLRDFTNDKAKIHAALDEFANRVPTTNAQGGSNDIRIRSLKTVCDNLVPIQGHKAILYFSAGMQRGGTDEQVELREAVSSCEQSNTSINPVDVRGLVEIPRSQAANGAAPGHTDPVMLSRTEPEYTPDADAARVVGPVLLTRVEAKYTSDAMRARLAGDVVLEAIVMPNGTVGKVRVVESLDRRYGLDDEAVKAVEQWRYRPAMLNGQPVPALVTATVPFRLQ